MQVDFVTANFGEFLFHVSRERPLRPTPIEPRPPARSAPTTHPQLLVYADTARDQQVLG
jgi:hypothetical protein